MSGGNSNILILNANTTTFKAEITGLLASLETLLIQELALMPSCKVVCTVLGLELLDCFIETIFQFSKQNLFYSPYREETCFPILSV